MHTQETIERMTIERKIPLSKASGGCCWIKTHYKALLQFQQQQTHYKYEYLSLLISKT